MPNNNRKKIQLYRNEEIYTPSAQQGLSALEVAKNDLASFSLSDGEVVIGRYQETNQNVKTVIAVAHDMSNNNEGMTFFTDSSNFVSKPVVLYQTDGTTGLLGVNASQIGENWQLENYDFTPYKYLRCYFKMGNSATMSADLTPSMIVELPLDSESKSSSSGMYISGGISPNPSNPTNAFSVLVAVDSTKTKLQVINQIMYDEYQYDDAYGNSETDANRNGRYLYKIEGCYDTINNASTTETEPRFMASAAHGITANDINNWNSMVSGGGISGITMNGESKGTSGVVDLGTVVTEETDPTVPSWAKSANKPSYTASEVGAVPTTRTVNGKALSSDITLTSTDVSAVPRSRTVNGLPLSDNINLTAEDVGALPNDTVIPTKVSDLTNDSGFTTNVGTITGITMNGVSKGTSGVVNLGTVLTSHQDISGKADKSEAIGSLTLALDSTNYKITLSGTKVDGTSFTVSNVIDLPLESVVVSGSYNNTTKKVMLTLQNGSTIDFSVADLVAGLQSEITSTNKLSADLISDGNTNKVVTSTEKNSWNNAVSNSHTHSNKTVLDGITSTDITNWNNKTDNVGTVTGVKMNNTTNNPTDGVVDLGTVITSETQLSKGTTTGSGNAVTDITVNGHQITLAKGSTFLTSHQSIKTINGNSLVGTGNVEIIAVPSFTSADNGKILGVVNGQLAWVTPTTIYTGSGAPSSSQGNDGDIYLQTN